MDLVPQVIEGQHAVEKHQHAVGNVEVIHSVLSDVLQPPHNVIRAISDRSGREWRQALHCRRAMLLQKFFDDVENIARASLDLAAARNRNFVAARLQPQKRPHTEECIPSNFFSALHRFQQEGVRLTVRDSKKGGNRRKQVGRD